jgi:hypothetical protein
MEPTPPAAASTNRSPVESFVRPNRSNSVSHAVIVVSGSAAASANDSDVGLRETMRSSTAWNSALLPWRVRSPANQTSSPTDNVSTCGPTASTIPAASYPRMAGVDDGCSPAQTLTSPRPRAHGPTRLAIGFGQLDGDVLQSFVVVDGLRGERSDRGHRRRNPGHVPAQRWDAVENFPAPRILGL